MTRVYINTHEQNKNYHRINENGITERRCSQCLEWKEESYNNYYFINKSFPDKGYNPDDRESYLKRLSIYNKKNRDKKRKQLKAWAKNNPDLLNKYWKQRKEKLHIMYEEEWESCKKYFIHKCAYCGLKIEEHYFTRDGITKLGDFHKEHVIDEGKNDLSNCIPSCAECNEEKGTKTLNEWYNINNPKYNRDRYLKIYQWYRWDYKKYILPKRVKAHQRMIDRLKEVEQKKKIC